VASGCIILPPWDRAGSHGSELKASWREALESLPIMVLVRCYTNRKPGCFEASAIPCAPSEAPAPSPLKPKEGLNGPPSFPYEMEAQGLKPSSFCGRYGTAEAVPLQNRIQSEFP